MQSNISTNDYRPYFAYRKVNITNSISEVRITFRLEVEIKKKFANRRTQPKTVNEKYAEINPITSIMTIQNMANNKHSLNNIRE